MDCSTARINEADPDWLGFGYSTLIASTCEEPDFSVLAIFFFFDLDLFVTVPQHPGGSYLFDVCIDADEGSNGAYTLDYREFDLQTFWVDRDREIVPGIFDRLTIAVVCSNDAECDDGIACTTDSCDLGTGECLHAPNDSACDDV